MSDIRVDPGFLLDCAQALVRAPSENPPGDERAVAAAARDACERAGLAVEQIETGPSRVNVIATLDSGRPGRTLVWNGHIDVVPAGDEGLWTHPPYGAVVADGALHGRGSADMKGGCAAIVEAARALREAGLPRAGRLVVQLVADEEVLGPHGTLALYDRGLVAADAAIVGEPTSLDVAIAERGMVWIRVRTSGVAAHGSKPDLGHSAIEDAARALLALRAMTWDDPHPLLGPPTLNVGVIRGGDKINIVPPWAEFEIDRRTIPGETFDSILAEVRETIEAAGVQGADAEIYHSAEPCEVSPDEEIVRLALEEVEAERGTPGRIGVMSGATDAHVLLGKAKIPTIVFGPGSLDVAHAANESVAVAELEEAARVYARVADRFLR